MSPEELNNCGKYRRLEFIIYMAILLVVFILGASLDAKGQTLKKTFKFATFYTAFSGGNSVADNNIYSVTNGLQTNVEETPFDYSFTAGVRKIARFGYENRAQVFYDGTEKSYSDAANIGRVKGFEFLFEADWRRQQGKNFLDQDYFLRYVAKNWIAKTEYLQDGFADVEYFEASERYRLNVNERFSFNIGIAQRISEPYGYNPLVIGYDYYQYSKEFWMHSWASVMPYHLNTGGEYSYFETTEGGQWVDYGLGLIFGWRIDKSLGLFLEGKYNRDGCSRASSSYRNVVCSSSRHSFS